MTDGFKVGDRVVLQRLDDWFFDKMEPGTASFLKSCVGRVTTIEGFDAYGHVELTYLVSADERLLGHQSYSHTVWVEPGWIKKG